MDSPAATERTKQGAQRPNEEEHRPLDAGSASRQGDENKEALTTADLVAGIIGRFDRDAITTVCDGLRALAGSPRVAIMQTDPAPEGFDPQAAATGSGSLYFLRSPFADGETTSAPGFGMAAAYQTVFAAAEQLRARACCVFASQIQGATPAWISGFAQPLLGGDADLVVPHYARRKFEGLLNVSVIAPLMRSLYGKRVQNPMGPDLGVSQRLFGPALIAEKKGGGGGIHSLASLASSAACGNLRLSEVYAGPRLYRGTDWPNVSLLLSAVLGPVFCEMERNAVCWQRIRGSAAVPASGEPAFVSQDAENVDLNRMVESFQLGNRELQEIWSLVLPPATLFELRKLLRLSAEQFHMDDALWARIVYDFALAHRLRTISRDHLLKSMTPLYLGWVASYARDLQEAGTLDVERRVERLAVAYESAKPYLLSRWRWPDRFSP
jgi:glucosylglycerate synthase